MVGNASNMNNCILQSDGACLVGNDIWFINRASNTLCTMDIDSAEIKIEFFLEEYMNNRALYRLCEHKGEIYVLPGKGNLICRYDIQKKQMNYVSEESKKDSWCHHYAIETTKDSIYFFPCLSSTILKINLLDLNVMEVIDLSFTKAKEQSDSLSFLTKKFITRKNDIIFASGIANKILFFDLETNRFKWKIVDIYDGGFKDIEKSEDGIYLLTNENRLIKMSDSFDIQKEYLLQEEYSYIVACNKSLVLVPRNDNTFMRMNLEKGDMYSIKYPEKHIFDKGYLAAKQIPFSDIVHNERETILFPRFSNMLVRIERSTGTISFKEWKYAEEYRKSIGYRMLEKDGVTNETYLSLQDYMSMI